ncbi:MAG: protein kinase [Deltaproteobacteria bacterium]|nr:protein kinase [Deltaproteobacteria bacterium]
MTTTTLKSGSQLGRFKIRRRLGRSETGIVYLAVDTLLDQHVVVKIFGISRKQDESFKRIKREVDVSRMLHDPGVCRVHDLHEESGIRFLVMEYVGGETLEEMLGRERRGMMQIVQAVEIVLAVAKVVAHMHASGVIHRNLKPSKIMVRQDGRVCILDFSLAHIEGDEEIAFVDKDIEQLRYTAPEVALGQAFSHLADLYSLGAILYRCITGKTPMETAGPVKESTGFKGSRPTPPSKLNNQVTRALEQVIQTAIAASPQSRYRNVDRFIEALEPTIQEVSIRARRPRRRQGDEEELAAAESVEDEWSDGTGVSARSKMERCTILFSDIVGITTFFDTYGDVAGRRRIERHNEALFPVVRTHSGTVLKTIGDAIMASFPDEDDAVDAAIGMQKALDAYNDRCTRAEDQIFVRIGINTGEAIVEYGDVFGDAVNVAARVSSKAEGDQILISEATYDLMTRNRDITQFHSQVELKGKTATFKLYQVDWLLAEEHVEPPDMSEEDTGAREAEEATQVFRAEEPGILDKAVEAMDSAVAKSAGKPLDTRVFLLIGAIILLLILGLTYMLCSSGPEPPPPQPQAGDVSPMERPGEGG